MNLLEVSFSGAVFIIAVIIIRTATINYMPKKTFLVLWETVLLRLIMPYTVPSAFSVYTLIDRSMSAPSFLEAETDNLVPAVSQEYPVIVQGREQLAANSLPVSVWFVLWCAGMILLAIFFIISYLRRRIEFRTALPVNSVYAEQWLKKRPLKRQISIRQSDRISTPLTYGIFRPVILMPKKTDWENLEQLQYIFAHEYVHICRFDAFVKLIAALILCIHWFNPFVWVLYIFFNRDMELVCDESVIRQFGETSKAAYSLMLIGMEEKKSGLVPFGSNFSKNATEERITAIMNTRQTTFVKRMSACLTVFVTVCLFATSAAASVDSRHSDAPAANARRTNAGEPAADDRLTKVGESAASDRRTKVGESAANKESAMSIIHESAEILHYEDGYLYIHDILTNNTDRTIVETQYCMLAYDENGSPLKLYWNFLDSSTGSSFENIVRSRENILSHQTEEYSGGWSLYDGEIMEDFPKTGDGGANQTAYSLICLMQVVFEDGIVWINPDYENWLQAYAGKEIRTEELQNYYPHEYRLVSE